MKYRSLTNIFYKVDLWVTLIHYPKYNISPSNSLQDIKQNCCTIKYRSLTYIYLIRSIYVSHWSIKLTMMFIHQIILKILSKITRSWNIGQDDTFTLRSKFGSHCFIIWIYDTHAFNSPGYIRQNHWPMKYRSHRHTFILRSNVGSYWLIIPKYNFVYQIISRCNAKSLDHEIEVTTVTIIYF